MSTNRHKLREFQWFEMETRVRQMVQQLITPFTKRIFETISSINSLKASSMEDAIKVEELRKIVTDDPMAKQINIFKDIDRKQEKLKSNLFELENKVSQTQKIVDKRIQIQDQRLQESKLIVMNNMKLKQRVSEQVFQQNQSIKQLRSEIQAIIGEIRSTLDTTIKNQQEDAKNNRSATQKLSDRIQTLEDIQKINEEKFQKNIKQHLQISNNIIQLSQVTTQTNRQIKSLQDNLIYIKKLGNYVQELQEKIEKQDFSLQHLSPLITQAQLSQTLYSVLPSKLKKRLIVYQYQKFSDLNNHILQTDPKKQKPVLFNGMSVLETVQKRNVKQIIDMKRKKLISMGIDIDNLNYQAKEKYYKEVSLHEDEVDEEGEIKTSLGLDNIQITMMINKMIDLASSQFSMKVEKQLIESKKYFQQIEDQLQHNLHNFQILTSKCSSSLEKLQIEQQLINNKFQEQISSINEYKESSTLNFENISSNFSTLMQFCTLINHLHIQDQLDKQSISLFGIKQHFMEHPEPDSLMDDTKRSIVHLQKQCFSCNGYPASTISAFKMACLAYTPSSIILDNTEYKREELLETSTKILQHLKDGIKPSQKSIIRFDETIKKKSHTQPTTNEGILHPSPAKGSVNRLSKLNCTISQIRCRTKSKGLRTEQSRRLSNAALMTQTFSEAKKRHSIYLQKKIKFFD